MTAVVIWVDRQHAKLFLFSEVKMERQTVHADQPEHHTHSQDQLDAARKERKLFAAVVDRIQEARALLILGPGVAKHHFHNYLSEHVPALARKVIACETVDHSTDAQIADMAMKYFWAAAASGKDD